MRPASGQWYHPKHVGEIGPPRGGACAGAVTCSRCRHGTAGSGSLAREASGSKHTAAKKAKMAPGRRQPHVLLPALGGGKRKAQTAAEPTTPAPRRRKQATA